MAPYPEWLHTLAWGYLSLSFLCAAIMIVDEIRHPQKMMMMNFVWPMTALYGGPVALWGYFKSAPKMTKRHMKQMHQEIQAELQRKQSGKVRQIPEQSGESEPSREQVAVGVSHCGAGCTLGDISAEWWVFLMGLKFAGGEFPTRILLDFLLAWSFGVVFQYFTIAPMRGLSFEKGVIQAIRADTLSIVSFQIGLFAWMALTYFVLFPGPHLHPTEAVFWFMMQVGMILGYFTSYPANVLLLKWKWKEKMPQYKREMKKMMRQQQEQQQQAA
ncbi:MAG TPA: DUF4396 domain-containing protein [Terriglobales bacterium]|nr:DUF4396 domain-containing protein [Terriglobales bacterium]